MIAGIFIGLRFLIDVPASRFTIGYVLSLNLESWRLEGLLVYGSLFALACAWVSQTEIIDSVHKQMLIVVLIPYIALSLIFGVWQEIRLWMPIYLLCIPLLKANSDA